MTIKVLLADDHQLVREGIKLVLDREEGVRVVGEASTGDAAVEATG
jgi:DNA-binding NarL/FixJ family response regulator